MSPIAKLWFAWRPSLMSAGLALLAFPPFNTWPFLFLALVPWLAQLRRTETGKQAWKVGYRFGFLFGLGQLFWIDQFVGSWIGSLAIGALPWLVACSLYALYFGWAGVLIFRAYQAGRLFLIPLAWAGIEVIRSYMPTFAFPWGLYANPLAEFPLLGQAAHVGTIYLVSALLVAVNVAWVEFKWGKPNLGLRWMVVSISAFLLTMPLAFRMRNPGMRVLAVQPGVNAAFADRDVRDFELARSLNDLLPADASEYRLVVLPEGMVTTPEMPPAPMFRLPKGAPIAFGGRRQVGEKLFQTGFLYDGEWQYADKTRLVIFGEFVPFRDIFPALVSSFKLPAGDLVPGEEGIKTLTVRGVRVGPNLCFEGLFPDISIRHAVQGADVIAVMSIDDWYMGTSAPDQLRQASVWRAIETGLPVVRAATLGYSMTVHANGQVDQIAPLGKPVTLDSTLRTASWRVPAAVLYVFPAVGVLSVLGLTFGPLVRRRSKCEWRREGDSNP